MNIKGTRTEANLAAAFAGESQARNKYTNNAEKAKEIVAAYEPEFASKDDYLSYMDSLNDSGDRIVYKEDGTADVRFS